MNKLVLSGIIFVLLISVVGSLILYNESPNKIVCNSTSSVLINYTVNHTDFYKPTSIYPPIKR